MSTLSQDEIDALVERVRKATSEKDVKLSPDDIKVLREVIKAWGIWSSFGVVGRWFAWLLMSIAAIAIAWGQIRTEVTRWFAGS